MESAKSAFARTSLRLILVMNGERSKLPLIATDGHRLPLPAIDRLLQTIYWLLPTLYWLSTDFYWLYTYFYWLVAFRMPGNIQSYTSDRLEHRSSSSANKLTFCNSAVAALTKSQLWQDCCLPLPTKTKLSTQAVLSYSLSSNRMLQLSWTDLYGIPIHWIIN